MSQPQSMSIPEALNLAAQCFRARKFAEAERIYRQVLQNHPNHIPSLHGLALLASEVGNRDAALQLIRRTIELNPNLPLLHQNLGELLQFRGEFDAAERAFRRAIELEPNFAGAVMKLGLLLELQNRIEQAREVYSRAVALAPQSAEAHCNLGDALFKLGKYQEAIESYNRAIELTPKLAAAYANRALAFDRLGKPQQTYEDAQRAIQIDPQLFAPLCLLGRLCYQQKRNEEAIGYFTRALRVDPQSAQVHNGMGIAYFQSGQYELACEQFNRAIAIEPNRADAYTNLGLAMADRGRYEEAISAYDKALTFDAASSTPVAETAYTRANRGLALLVTGHLEEGFKEYDYRWRTADFAGAGRDYGCPRWEGEDLSGKTILLWHEQGFGDTIQFIRYAALLTERGARAIVVETQLPLHSLLRNVQGVSQIISHDHPLPADLDFHTPFLRLPGLFHTTLETIPAKVPYIQADPSLVETWRERLAPLPGFRIGIAWQGRTAHRLDRQRSVALEKFAPLAQLEGICWISLQFEHGSEQAKSPFAKQMGLIDLTSEVKDFSDTAALIQNLDLVIAVDTAIVHLAGAMGRPVWTLLSSAPDWRWMLNRNDSPWYPTMRLFRQPALGDWNSVFSNVSSELRKLMPQVSSSTTAYIALGSNLGDRQANIRKAIDLLAQTPGIRIGRVSTFLENPAVGMDENAPPFLNAAMEIQTTLHPDELLHRLLAIEHEMGRTRRDKWEPRIIDLDLLLYGDQILSSQELILPHPRMHERIFVLQPLAEIAPQVIHPKFQKTIAQLLANLPHPQSSATTSLEKNG